MAMFIEESKIKQALSKLQYSNVEVTKKDVINALRKYTSLIFKTDSFVFNDGKVQELLNLQGTIPVNFKGTVYHFPICIWLMDTHPSNAPMCYVTPTSEMRIKVSMYVDHNGKIYLPYLHQWVPYGSDLVNLIQVMIVTFGSYPPVYSKRKDEVSISNMPNYPIQQPFPPVPRGGTNNMPYPPDSSSFAPYPPSSGGYPGASSNIPAYPPVPPIGRNMYGDFPSLPESINYPPGMNFPPYPVTQPSPIIPGRSEGNSGTISEEHIRASLLSAVGDKLRRRLREQFSQLQAELETLRRTQQELNNGSTRLNDLLKKLNNEKAELEKNIIILQDKESELEKEIFKSADNQSIDVDEAVTTIAPLYKQMLSAFAEEAATEDAIYYLGEGLRNGTIDLDAFLKQVRQLSRRQFMLRALMLVCRQKASMAD